MASALQDEFSVDGTQLGSLSSAYFWPYLVIQFFLGWLFQRFGVELVMMVSMLVAGAGTIVFGVAGSLGVAVLGRCLIGLGVGAAWLGLVTVAQGKSFTQAGLSTTMVGSGLMFGLLGALIAQTPLTLAIQDAGFRPVLLWSALAPAAVAAVMAARLCSAQRGGGGGGAKSHLASVPPGESTTTARPVCGVWPE
jgi:MFS family permease